MHLLVLVSIQIFLVSFFINLLWEINHSVLYTTCLKMKLKPCVRLRTVMSIKDGFWVTLFYVISVFLFDNLNILQNPLQLLLFLMLALFFSFADEKISIKKKRWEYSHKMPLLLGVGVTPFFELATTGTVSFFVVFIIFGGL